MTTTLLTLTLALMGFADRDAKTPRKPSVIAPSLPQLTREEEAKLDDVLDRFILADTGRLRGAEARKAIKEFDDLGSEAIPALIRGLARAARINHSCPILMITKKLTRMLMASEDAVLLEFARDEIGAAALRSRHAATLQDLRVKLLLRKNALARMPARAPSLLSTPELVKSARTLRGPALLGVVRELGKRDGKQALEGLGVAAASSDRDVQKLGREMLDANLGRQTKAVVKERLEDGVVEVRRGAIRVAGTKHADLMPDVIERLIDDDASVRAEARETLRKHSKGKDFGPEPTASKLEWSEARRRWRSWWDEQAPQK